MTTQFTNGLRYGDRHDMSREDKATEKVTEKETAKRPTSTDWLKAWVSESPRSTLAKEGHLVRIQGTKLKDPSVEKVYEKCPAIRWSAASCTGVVRAMYKREVSKSRQKTRALRLRLKGNPGDIKTLKDIHYMLDREIKIMRAQAEVQAIIADTMAVSGAVDKISRVTMSCIDRTFEPIAAAQLPLVLKDQLAMFEVLSADSETAAFSALNDVIQSGVICQHMVVNGECIVQSCFGNKEIFHGCPSAGRSITRRASAPRRAAPSASTTSSSRPTTAAEAAGAAMAAEAAGTSASPTMVAEAARTGARANTMAAGAATATTAMRAIPGAETETGVDSQRREHPT